MNQLLARVLDAHGGMDRWNGYQKVGATIVTGGGFFALKGKTSGLFRWFAPRNTKRCVIDQPGPPSADHDADGWRHPAALSKAMAEEGITISLMRDMDRIAAQISREGALFRERLRTGEAFAAFAERRKPDFSKIAG
jgi:hypothetical protein